MNENQNESPTPKQQILGALSQIDTLEKMRQEPGFDETTATELRASVVDEINDVYEKHPEIADLMDPVFARSALIRKQDKEARAKLKRQMFPSPLGYQNGSLYERLSEESQRAIDQVMLDLLEQGMLEDASTVVTNAGEAAKKLGLEQSEVDRAYGLLSAIEDNPDPTDIIEFVAIDFNKQGTGEGVTPGVGGGEGEGGPHYALADTYVGRVRRSNEREIISIVLDAVPPEPLNAIYVLRNDDKSIESVETSLTSKVEARANGARRVYHTEQTGEAGTLKRINKWLLMSFDKFRDPETRV